jgi:hypothetical protein
VAGGVDIKGAPDVSVGVSRGFSVSASRSPPADVSASRCGALIWQNPAATDAANPKPPGDRHDPAGFRQIHRRILDDSF